MPSLGKFLKHQSQWNDKFQVHMQIHTAFGVKVASPAAQFFVTFKRGDTHKGSTMKLNSNDPSSITFDSSCCFSFPCTLYYYDVAKKDYEEKIVTVYFNEENAADPTSFVTLGKTNIDLCKYAKEVPLNASKSFPLTEVLSKPKKGDALRLQITLTLTCVCVVDPSAQTEPEPTSTESTPTATSPLSTTTPPPTMPLSITPPPSTSPLASTPPNAPNPASSIPKPLADGPSLVLTPPHSPTAPIRIPSATTQAPPSRRALVKETSASSGVESLSTPRARSDDGESISSFSSRNSPRNSPPSSSSSSPSSPPRFSTSFEVGSNGSVGSGGNPLSLPSSSSASNLKSYLHSPPVKMHLLERQASDGLLNTGDIAIRLASRYQEICKSREGGTASGTSTPTPGTPTQTSRADALRASQDHSARSSPSTHRRVVDFKSEKMKSTNDLKSPLIQKQLLQKQKEDERYLLEEIIPMPPAYSNGVPVLAYVIFRALLRWRSFHPNNILFIDSFFTSFNNLTNIPPECTLEEILLYKISTIVTLRHILHTELHVLSSDNVSTVLKDFSRRLKKSLIYVYDLYYSKVKEDLDKAIETILANVKEGKSDDVTRVFEKHLKLVCGSIVFESLQHQLIYQIFYYFNVRMLNSLLQHTIKSQCEVGLGVKMLVRNIESWAATKNENPLPQAETVVQLQSDSVMGWVYNTCRKALSEARQAADVLVVKKSTLIEPKIRADVCPSLTPQQLLILLEGYVPDEFDPEPMHPGVVKSISDEIPHENSYQATPTPTSPILDATQPAPLDTHFTQSLALNSLSIPTPIISHPSFAFLRDVCTDSNSTHW